MSVSVSWHRNLATFICLQLRNPWMKLKGCLSSANPTAWPVTRYCVAIPGTAELSWSGSAGLTFFKVSIWPDWTNGVLAHSISHQKVLNCKSHSLMNSMLFSFTDLILKKSFLWANPLHAMIWVFPERGLRCHGCFPGASRVPPRVPRSCGACKGQHRQAPVLQLFVLFLCQLFQCHVPSHLAAAADAQEMCVAGWKTAEDDEPSPSIRL